MGAAEEGRWRLERELLLELLELRSAPQPAAALARILERVVALTGARRGYLELFGDHTAREAHWTLTQGCSPDEEAAIRAVTSRGIVAAALASGRTVHTPFAMLDERFADQASVRGQRLEAVLCVPVGTAPAGVLYLEGQRGAGPFAAQDVASAELVATQLAPSLGLVARAEARRIPDPTRPFRERLRLEHIVGRSPALAALLAEVEPYMKLDVTVLLTGDTGTGKTQLARAIHDNSPRRHGPFVELNCAAIPEGLIESELFGTMPSAFPGARRTAGKVEAAEGGTLFLDEIVEIPYAAQGKLLQLLQSHQYYPLASTKLVTANVRVIAATHKDLRALVTERRFREDLYYRINVVTARMPSLAERRGDIPLLVDELLSRVSAEHRLPRIPASEQLQIALQNQQWHGNIRELRNQVERALIRAATEDSPQVEVRHLDGAPPASERPLTFHEATRIYQRELLGRELAASGWNVAAVAERLDLTRSHVYNLIHQFKLSRDKGA